MPTTKLQKFIYAAITVFITVHCFVFYNVAIENIRAGYGVSIAMFGYTRIGWYVLIEFICALSCELLVGSPVSEKLAFSAIDPQKQPFIVVQTMIICCTVFVMCPLMSFLAEIIYGCFFPLVDGIFSAKVFFSGFVLNWLRKVVINFPFALLTQLFYIQPLVRLIFKGIMKLDGKRKAKLLADKQ